MNKIEIEHQATKRFSKTILDYLTNQPSLTSFYKYSFDLDSFIKVIKDKNNEEIDRNLLSSVLAEQNKKLLHFKEVNKNIELLNNDHTFTITTGHQLALFGGPLYFIYKILSVIKTTKLLKEKLPEYNFVPVFWMASEDHGIGEVSTLNIFNKIVTWEQEPTGPIGEKSTDVHQQLLNEIFELLGEGANADKIKQLLKQSYQAGLNVADATRLFIGTLFAEEGLVIVDGNDKRLKAVFKSVIIDELTNQPSFRLVESKSQELIQAGYHKQVEPRAVNMYYIHNDWRKNIQKDNEFYLLGDERVDEKTLLELIENYPERFSPNVVLRPVYQEKILPNLAYIGGPGEIAYWLQLKDVFDHFNVNFPMLVLRDNVMIINRSIKKKMEKLSLNVHDLFDEKHVLEKNMVSNSLPFDINLTEEQQEIAKIFDSLKQKVAKMDSTLVASVEAEKTKQLNAIDTFSKRLMKAEKKQQEDQIIQLHHLLEKLFPNQTLQERHDNFIPYYLKYGNQFFDELLLHFNPFNKKFIILEEE
jgi:bacillithiol synthase